MTEPAPYHLPPIQAPGLSVRATFLATDGSRPQELILEWKDDPGLAALDFALNAITEMARPSEVRVEIEPPDGTRHARMEQMRAAAAARPTPFSGVDGGNNQVPQEEIDEEHGWARTAAPCGVSGPGHDDPGHGCVLYAGHEPVEPDGRAHRCACGGIFATSQETPDVAGRAGRSRRREDR